jgi:hypothetical protein
MQRLTFGLSSALAVLVAGVLIAATPGAAAGRHTPAVLSPHTATTPLLARHASLTPAAVTPAITLNVKSASPGNVVEVEGTGFGNQELVTLALDGAAVPGTPSVLTTAEGEFNVHVTIPTSLLQGTNTFSAFGATGRGSATALLTGVQPTATTLYFAGVQTDGNEQVDMPILNATGQAAQVNLSFYYDEPHATGHATLSIPAHSRGTADLNKLAGSGLHFGIKLTSKSTVTAQVRTSRPGMDGATMLGVAAPQTTWYLAEGYTGLTFHEVLWLLNPGTVTSHVTVHLLPFSGKPARTVSTTVAPQFMSPVDVNDLMPNQSVSAIVNASQPMVVARRITFSNNGYGLTEKPGTNAPAASWLFAEGTTTTVFQTYLTILNPQGVTAQVTAHFFGKDGQSLGTRALTVPKLSRANLKLNDFLHASDIASVVSSNVRIVVESPIYFGSPNDPKVAGSDVFGRNGAALNWTFPAGNTAERNEFVLIYNPSTQNAEFNATFYGTNGDTVTKRITVGPDVRATVNVNTLIPGLTAQHGMLLQATNNVGSVAYQTIFPSDHSNLSTTEGFAR